MHYAVIMAGGAGKRLWPLSRASKPKQLLPLLGGKSLLAMAIERLEGLFDHQNICVITNAEYADLVAAELPQLPRQNIIGEPEGRDTANAIALGVALLSARDPDATMAVFTADHVIRPIECFQATVRRALDVAEHHDDALLTLGVRPTWPHTGLGYIHAGDSLADGVFEVEGFQEKPNHQVARRYVESQQYYWNSGMFVWKLPVIRAALEEFLPESVRKLKPVTAAAKKGKDVSDILAQVYPTLERISIDYAVMEKAHRVLMVELTCEWLDIGSWPALESVVDLDEGGNVIIAPNAVTLDSYRNVVVSEDDHLLALMGMDGCIVVHSKDATLVCNKSDSQRLKELVDLIAAKHGRKYV